MKLRKVLFLHGLESGPVGDKTKFLAQSALVIAPYIDYEANGFSLRQGGRIHLGLVDNLTKLVVDNSIDIIVGSSMGGLMALALGYRTNTKVLAFNPPIISTSVESMNYLCESVVNQAQLTRQMSSQLPNPSTKVVVVGLEDDVVNPTDTIKAFSDTLVNVFTESNMGHRTPVKVLKKYF